MNLLLVAGGAAALWVLTSGASLFNAAGKIGMIIPGVRARFSGGSLLLTLKAQFTNPTSQDIILDYIFLDLIYNGSTLGQIREDIKSKAAAMPAAQAQALRDSYTIRGNSVSNIDLNVTIGAFSAALTLGPVLWQAITSGSLPANKSINVKGDIRANGWSAPYNETIPLTV